MIWYKDVSCSPVKSIIIIIIIIIISYILQWALKIFPRGLVGGERLNSAQLGLEAWAELGNMWVSEWIFYDICRAAAS